METLALWRDISLVYLIILCFIPWLVPLVALYFAQKYLRLGRKKLRPLIRIAQIWAERIQKQTNQVAHRVIEVPISAQANVTRATTTMNAVRREFFDNEQ